MAPTPGGQSSDDSSAAAIALKPQRTVVEALGEEAFKEMGLPDNARNLTVEQAVQLGAKIVVTDHLGIPREATGKMTAEEISDVAALLQKFEARDEIKSEEFWKRHVEHGFDNALGPHMRDMLGLPEGVHVDSLASKIMEDAGEIQRHGLDITKQESWDLYKDFQAGNKSSQNLIDIANSRGTPGKGGRGSNDGTPGQSGNPGNGNSSNGNNGSSTGHPGNGSSDLPGQGSGGQHGNNDSTTTPPGSQSQNRGNQGRGDNSGLDGDSFEIVDSESFSAVVTHNDDGSFTVDIYRNDGAGNSSKVSSGTYSDADGDGVYRDDKGSSSDGKPPEGTMEAEKDEEKEEYKWSWSEESDSSSSDDSSADTDTDAGDAGDTDTETNPTDEYTPDPNGGVYYNYEWMVAMYQKLSADKYNTGKGDKDSTPNPMADGNGNGERRYNYKDTVVLPVDGNSGSTANIPVEALKQSLTPGNVQGGVIDPVKNKDQ